MSIFQMQDMNGSSGRYHFFIDRSRGSCNVELHIVQFLPNQNLRASWHKGELRWVEFKDDEPVPPLLRLPPNDAMPIIEAMAQGFRGAGITVKEEGILQGQLDATQKHLKDLRYLLKLPKQDSEVL